MTTVINDDISAYWLKEKTTGECYLDQSDLALYVNPHIDEDYLAMAIQYQDKYWLSLHPQLCVELSITPDLTREAADTLRDALTKKWHGADQFFYFSQEASSKLQQHKIPSNIRALTSTDAAVFQTFCEASSEEDLDGASVELDHWLVYGLFFDEKLVAAASMYPWDDKNLAIADLGVLTLSEHRGKGYARKLVSAICQIALDKGYQPQYRCQLDNQASLALANSLNLIPYIKWDVIVQPNAVIET
ncbi:TPA: GNAT family N-acetyltransferase [Providencia rettgeri]|uniref:GNAT family N-acetyltransferase n=1 Tax=Providencia TaxID=586 RepID=UPI001B8FD325|nr:MULTISPECIES: GNAT family N-acetyltransferase [unclassified Providencia]EMB5786196.1 GNAT family N-acetyltransferase [Providencia rettgeri]HBC7428717.1 GNAT family N-acetyltransferase [Providencia rettgeri]